MADLIAERAGYPAPADLLARRGAIADAVAGGFWRVEPAPREVSVGGVRALRFDPPSQPRAVVLHIHGGAFRLGCPEQIMPFAAALAAQCGVAIVCPAYRLAPEHPFPAGLNDVRLVYDALQAETAVPLFLSGDSAGGGLAASLAASIRGVSPPVAGLILLSPWLDLTVSRASYDANAQTDPLFSRESASEAARLYLQGLAADDPSASALNGEVEGLPPTLVSVGAGEVLLDDAQAWHDRLSAAGVPVTLDIVPGMEHVAATRGFALEGATRTFVAIVAFIAAHTV